MSNYILRKSQQEAANQTIDYFLTSQETQPEFLWNAVMRWGKCLTSLNFVYQYNHSEQRANLNKSEIKNVLILTFFPATEDSWSRLFENGIEEQDNFKNEFNFISIQNKHKPKTDKVNIFFTSFQEIYNGKNKKDIFYNQNYDLLILDEYHYGAYNGKAKSTLRQSLSDDAGLTDEDLKAADSYKKLSYKYRLVLTGTPYKDAITSEFTNKNVFKFNYFDEQMDKLQNGNNSDYKDCPQLKLFSVNLKISEDNKIYEPNIYNKIDFLVNNKSIFGAGKTEPMFLNGKYGASFWLVPNLKTGKQIADYIKKKYSNIYHVIDLCSYKKDGSLDFVRKELQNAGNKYSIILSYNKLTLGVTIPEIENVVFLRDITTAELYMQAGCRAKSQYSGKIKKNDAYLISFDINNDFEIFQQITSNDITESDFLKLLPISVVDATLFTVTNSIKESINLVSDKSNFLDALANVNTNEMVRKSVSTRVSRLADIPDDIIEALNKISGIGESKGGVIPTRKPNEKPFMSDSEKAKRQGYRDGKSDKALGAISDSSKHIGKLKNNPELKASYEKGYLEGYNYIEKNKDGTKNDSPKEDNPCEAVKKIQLLIKRFLYLLIGDYYRENKFLDINDPENIPEGFFSSLLGFDRDMFVELYNLGIIDTTYIDTMVNTFKSRENHNTSYLGLSKEEDYIFIDSTAINTGIVEEKKKNTIDKLFDSLIDTADTGKLEEEFEYEIENLNSKGKKRIYIAKPSQFLIGIIQMFTSLKEWTPKDSEKYNQLIDYIEYFKSLAQGVKIGETHRDPTVRCEELNGYTDKHLLYEIYDSIEVPEDESDVKFHRYLEEKGYKRIEAGTRKERFDMNAETALKELKKYLSQSKKIDFSKLTEDEIDNLSDEDFREYRKWLKTK